MPDQVLTGCLPYLLIERDAFQADAALGAISNVVRDGLIAAVVRFQHGGATPPCLKSRRTSPGRALKSRLLVRS